MKSLALLAAIGAALWLPLAFMEAMALQAEIDGRQQHARVIFEVEGER